MKPDVDIQDQAVRGKARVLAVVILAIAATALVLSIVNLLQGQYEYNLSNAVFLAFVSGLFVINWMGYTRVACVLTVAVIVVASTVFLSEEVLASTFIIMCIPVFISSFLLVPWGGILVFVVVVGVLVIDGSTVNLLSLFTFAAVTTIVYLLARSLDRAYLQSNHRAFHDALTGLPNRALFLDRLQKALDRSPRDQRLLAVLFMDLDNFKVVNDVLGHEAGDELLITVARRIQACLRPKDTAARLGGDEFTVLLDGVTDVGEAIRVARRIIETLGTPIKLGSRQIFVGTSVGISLSEDADRESNLLLRNADVALYKAKKKGKACCEVFNPDMYNEVLRRLELENDLRRAIEGEELRIYYQPKVLLKSGTIVGMEALVRWEHPERGLILPGEFIPLAEETGLIVPLGLWMLQETCRQAREWQLRYPAASSLVTSVNLSVKQFQEPILAQKLAEILREAGLNPRCLQLEITESVVAEDVRYAVGLLLELKELGVQLALDDFGTGYSSLASLRRFPLDALKIDKMFVDGLGKSSEDTAIVQLVIDLAHAVGMNAVAEGVRTVEQLHQLRKMGCDQAQGYYFFEPLGGQAAEALLADPLRWLLDPRATEQPRGSGIPFEGRRYFDSKS